MKPSPSPDPKHARLLDFSVSKITENMQRRLIIDGIDDETRRIMAGFEPVFEANIAGVVASFYRHVLVFPETRRFFEGTDVEYLKARQVDHWRRMLACTFDEAYVRGAVAIGLRHHEIGLPLFLYLSGCNRILCDLTSLAIMHHSGALVSSQTVASIIKIVALDMDITISCYFVADRLRPQGPRRATAG